MNATSTSAGRCGSRKLVAPTSLGVIYRRARRALARSQEIGNTRALATLEKALPHSSTILGEYPPIFIVGAPRCGSTLLIQAVTRALNVAYMSNRHALLFGAPALVEWLAPPNPVASGGFSSHHGVTAGTSGPSECGAWWYRFFPSVPPYVSRGELSVKEQRAFRRSLETFTFAAKRPVVLKNLYASVRIQEIARIIPEARFIFIQRGVVANAHSLLEGRMQANGNYGDWWSLPTPGYEDLLDAEPAVQVIEQIRRINSLILKDLGSSIDDPDQIMEVQYEEFCDDPRRGVDSIGQFIGARSRAVDKGRDLVPGSFNVRSEIRIQHDLYQQVRAYAGKR
jgi:hypothetical protein